MFPQEKRVISILGSTGSIGTSALEVVRQHRDKIEVYGLAAGTNVDLLAQQAKEFQVAAVAIADETKYLALKEALKDEPIHVWAGEKAIEDLAASTQAEMLLTAMVGVAGLRPTIAAIQTGRTIALANKETLVVAGKLMIELARKHKAVILPVDSEHSAIFQCLVGETQNQLQSLMLTASGGPFWGYTQKELQAVKPKEALKHPNWQMGPKVSIDSATMMNKGLEMIEAKWLFGLSPQQIKVFIHRQSIIHSMVSFTDGSVKAQLSVPDMKIPIAYALLYPFREDIAVKMWDPLSTPELGFEAPDEARFPSLSIARSCMQEGGALPCVMNAANEVAVERFLKEQISFTQIPELVESVIAQITPKLSKGIEDDLESLLLINQEAKAKANEWTK